MPMSFPDFESLKRRAKQREFRQPHENETEEQFRTAFADFMMGVDRVESAEIRNKVGWDRQDPLSMLGSMLGSDGMKNLQSIMRSHHYNEPEADGFSFDWNSEQLEIPILKAIELSDLFDSQELRPLDKENFQIIHSHVTELFEKFRTLKNDMDVIQVLLNNGHNEVKKSDS